MQNRVYSYVITYIIFHMNNCEPTFAPPCRWNQTSNHNPTLLRTIKWLCIYKPQHPSICNSHSLSFSLTLLYLPLPYFPLIPSPGTAGHSRAQPSTTPSMMSSSQMLLPLPVHTFFSCLRALQTSQHHTHLNHHFLQEAFSNAPRCTLPWSPWAPRACSAHYLLMLSI